MTDKIKFSIILPIYNVEKYLPECIDSIINQTYANFEIICVNDGSTDNSAKILDNYTNKDSRIKIYNENNQGQGMARNFGIQKSTGDYILFIDPDDWILPNTLEKLEKYILKNNPDVVQFLYNVFYEETGEYSNKSNLQLNFVKNDSYSLCDIPKKHWLDFKTPCWDKCYKTSFIKENNLKFLSHRTGEDILFIWNILFNNVKINFINEVFYIYRKRLNSVTTTNNHKNTLYIFEQIDFVKNLLIKCNLYDEIKTEFKKYKLRLMYEGDKYCSNELSKKFLEMVKQNTSIDEYFSFLLKKYISLFLRKVYSKNKGISKNNNMYNVIIICGIKIWQKI